MPEVKQVLKNLHKIEIKTNHLVHGILQGAYESVFKGQGIEFSEVREYNYGDDIRAIDWNVTARMNRPYVKEFIEERDLTLYFLFDISGSNEFGSITEKKERAIELTASLMFAALKHNDSVGMVLFSDHIESYHPAKKGRRHVLKMIRELINHEPKSRKTDIKNTLIKASSILKQRGMVFIISDFLSEDFSKPLTKLQQRHEVIAINMSDQREQELPNVGYIRLEDEETGEQILINTSDSEIREQYNQLAQARRSSMKRQFQKTNMGCIQLQSHEPFHIPMQQFFSRRRR